jgi:hypothetical protein
MEHLVRTTLLSLALALGCLRATTARAAHEPLAVERGPAVVARGLPELYQALLAVAGPRATERLLENWCESDVVFYRLKNHGLLEAALATATAPSVERIFLSFGLRGATTLGEAYGNAFLGKLADESGSLYFDEVAYDAYNPYGRRPDGLLVRIEGPKLLLLQVFESKVGTGGFDRGQAKDYLKTWQQRGIILPVNGRTRHFAPTQIVLRGPDDEERAIGAVTNAELEACTTLVATQTHPGFRGRVLPLPILAATAQDVTYRWIELLTQGRRLAPERENFRVPPLETPQEVFDYQTALRNFLLERLQWPKSHGTTGVEHFLARELSRRQGQARAFIEDLDDETRMVLASAGSMPARTSLESRLRKMSPSSPGALSSYHAYRSHFEGAVPVEKSTLARDLVRNSPYGAEWAAALGLPPPPSKPACGDALVE